jgi:hypothetical protein
MNKAAAGGRDAERFGDPDPAAIAWWSQGCGAHQAGLDRRGCGSLIEAVGFSQSGRQRGGIVICGDRRGGVEVRRAQESGRTR